MFSANTTTMRFKILVTLFGCVLAASNYFDRDRITETPRGMNNFEPAKVVGKWYMIKINNPCRWAGADKFTDWYSYYSLDGATGTLSGLDVWRRVDVCTRAPFTLNMTGPASFTIDDTIGDLFTGHGMFVDTDYVSYLVMWGCTRPSIIPDVCDEFMFQLKTRTPHPSQSTMQKADAIFDMYWGVKTSDIIPVQHTKPCHFSSEPEYSPIAVNRLNPQLGGPTFQNGGPLGGAPTERMWWEDLLTQGSPVR